VKHRLSALAGALSLFAAIPGFAQTTLTIAHRQQQRHDPHARADERLHGEEPGTSPLNG